MKLEIVRIVTGELEENCFIVWNGGQNEAVVVDAGADAELIDAELKARKLTVAALLLTHCHGDHIGAVSELKSLYPNAVVYVPEAEAEWMLRPTLNLSYFLGASITAPGADRLVCDGDRVQAAGLEFKALHVPGHSPGGTAYFVEDEKEKPPHLLCGDILFSGSIGRTDLPGGAGEEVLVANIRKKLFVLPAETVVHPGHGPDTSIGFEKKSNPYCGE
ncbi:MAG TPA: MBL fold metallo-hydrolase [Planctomycetota bacterium]|jgi:glyoxylase-like metal-dependent hydrolase (beta-lactamase superfamily II)